MGVSQGKSRARRSRSKRVGNHIPRKYFERRPNKGQAEARQACVGQNGLENPPYRPDDDQRNRKKTRADVVKKGG